MVYIPYSVPSNTLTETHKHTQENAHPLTLMELETVFLVVVVAQTMRRKKFLGWDYSSGTFFPLEFLTTAGTLNSVLEAAPSCEEILFVSLARWECHERVHDLELILL